MPTSTPATLTYTVSKCQDGRNDHHDKLNQHVTRYLSDPPWLRYFRLDGSFLWDCRYWGSVLHGLFSGKMEIWPIMFLNYFLLSSQPRPRPSLPIHRTAATLTSAAPIPDCTVRKSFSNLVCFVAAYLDLSPTAGDTATLTFTLGDSISNQYKIKVWHIFKNI